VFFEVNKINDYQSSGDFNVISLFADNASLIHFVVSNDFVYEK